MLPELSEVRRLRRALGITQKALSKLSGVSQSAIAKIERGSLQPSYHSAKRIFEALEEHQKHGEKTAGNIMNTHIMGVRMGQKLTEAIKIMKRGEISQLLVMDSQHHITGSITEKGILADMEETGNFDPSKSRVLDVMEDAFPTIGEKTPLPTVAHILRDSLAVVVMRGSKAVGIITKSDLLKTV